MASEGAGRGGALSRQGSMDAYTRLSDLLTSGGQDPVDLYSSAESGLSGLSGLSVGAPGKGTLDNTLEPHKENQSNGDGDDIAKPTLQLVHTAEPSSSSGSRDGITLSSDVESGPQQQRRTQIPSVPPAPIGRRMSTEAAWDEMRVSASPSSKRSCSILFPKQTDGRGVPRPCPFQITCRAPSISLFQRVPPFFDAERSMIRVEGRRVRGWVYSRHGTTSFFCG